MGNLKGSLLLGMVYPMDVCELGLAHHSFPKDILRRWPLGWMAFGMSSVSNTSRLGRGGVDNF